MSGNRPTRGRDLLFSFFVQAVSFLSFFYFFLFLDFFANSAPGRLGQNYRPGRRDPLFFIFLSRRFHFFSFFYFSILFHFFHFWKWPEINRGGGLDTSWGAAPSREADQHDPRA